MSKYSAILLIGLTVLIAVGSSSCKSRKKLISGTHDGRIRGKVLEQVLKKEIDYNYLEIKGSVRTDALGKKQTFSLTYRNLEDSLVWVSVRAMLGIEVARAICTKDSVWVFSRIAHVKEKGDWKMMSDLIGYPIDFYAFQAIMARKLFVPGRSDNIHLNKYLSRKNENGLLLIPDFSDPDQKKILIENGFLPQFLLDQNKKLLLRTRVSHEDASWMLDVVYGSETNKHFGGLPAKITMDGMDMDERMELDLRILMVKIDQELKFPFSWF
ncbi:MAG: DUF4292 domain-containing protein [Bacteroidales bacterium]|nr:DUF4292 domain-containing protein [Bacteroidales bacterium]